MNAPISPTTQLVQNVLHVTECFDAGTGIAINHMARHLKGQGIASHLLFHDRGGRLAFEEDNPFVSLERFSSLRQLPRATLSSVRSIRPDLIHIHSSKAGAIVRSIPRLRRLAPIVYSPHGYSFIRKDISRLASLAYWSVERLLSTKNDALVAVSPHEYTLATTLNHEGSTYLAMNVPPEPARTRIHFGAIPARPVIGFLGRITEAKDPRYAAALVEFLGEHLTLAPHFLWIGDGDKVLADRLRQANIEVTGWLEHRQVVAHLQRINLLIHTARWEAAVPMALIEAMALGVPVAARSIPNYVGMLPSSLTFSSPTQALAIIERALSGTGRDSELAALTTEWIRAQSPAHLGSHYALTRSQWLQNGPSQEDRGLCSYTPATRTATRKSRYDTL